MARLTGVALDASYAEYADLDHPSREDTRMYARLHAVGVLSLMGEAAQAAIDPLLPLLDEEDDDLREEIPLFYASVGQAAVEPLRRVLQNPDADTYMRTGAGDSLEQIGETHAHHVLSPGEIIYGNSMKLKHSRVTAATGGSLVIFSSLFYASYGIWTKLIGSSLGGYTASAIRSAIVLAILCIFIRRQNFKRFDWQRHGKYAAGAVITALFIWGPLYFAINTAGVGVSLTVNYAAIVIGMFIFGRLFAAERITIQKFASAIFGLLGLSLIFGADFKIVSSLAMLAATMSGLASAANMLISKKLPYSTLQSAVIVWIASVVANLFMALILKEPITVVGWHIQWLYLIAFGVASVIASSSFIAGVKRIDVGLAGILGLLEVVFGLAFGIIFFGERPSYAVITGALVIMIAAMIPYVPARQARSST